MKSHIYMYACRVHTESKMVQFKGLLVSTFDILDEPQRSFRFFSCFICLIVCYYFAFQYFDFDTRWTAAVVQSVRAFALHPKDWVFESQPRQNQVVKTSSNSYTAKRSSIVLSVTGSRRWPLWTNAPFHSRFSTLKNPHCSMAMSAKHMSKLAVLLRQYWRLLHV